MLALIGKKLAQTQKFLTDGTRIPVTIVETSGNMVMMHKTQDKDGYTAVQLGFGTKKNANKPSMGHATKAHLQKAPQFLAEARFADSSAVLPEVGSALPAATVFEPGDIIDVQGVSKGKGFAGGVKRYHFRGGPKTHGQSDRHRAPGSIGSGTTPGRVYKGKRMAGKMGNDTVTLKNLEVVKLDGDQVWVRGLVPGKMGAMVILEQTGKKDKKFPGVLKTDEELAAEKAAEEKATMEAEAARVAAEEEAKKQAEIAAKEAEASAQPEETAAPVEQVEEIKAEESVEAPAEPKEEEAK